MQNRIVRSALFVVAFLFLLLPSAAFAQSTLQPQNGKAEKSLSKEHCILEVRFEGLDTGTEDLETNQPRLSESEARKLFRENKIKFHTSLEIESAIQILKEWLFKYGYLDANVLVYENRFADSSRNLTFSIDKGTITRVTEIRFVGNKVFDSEELVGNLKQCLKDSWKIFDENHYIYCTRKNITPYALSKGYLNFKVENPKMQRNSSGLTITIPVEEGMRCRVGEIKIEGAKIFTQQQILEMIEQKPGDIADMKSLREFLFEKLNRIYADKGYVQFDAEIQPEYIEPTETEQDRKVNFTISFYEGNLFKIRNIEFLGVDAQTEQFLRQVLSVESGQAFNKTKFEKGIERINELNRFAHIDKDKDVELRTTDESVFESRTSFLNKPKLLIKPDKQDREEIFILDLIIRIREM